MHIADSNRRWLALCMVCLASLMIVLDATIVNVALPAIQRDLGFSQATLAWVVNGYLLTFGGCMLLAGRMADILGRRTVLMFGIALFSLASLVCGLSQSQEILIAARAIQGVGGSIVSGVSASIVLILFPEQRERAKAMSIWGFVGSGGGTVGVIAGGVLTQSLNWHWIFLVNVPLGALALALAAPLLPKSPGSGMTQGFDLKGALAVLLAPMLGVYALVNAGQAGADPRISIAAFVAALVTGAVFVLIERGVSNPLVPLEIFRTRTIAVTNAIIAISGAAFFGWFFFSPLYAQQILGFDSLQTGLTFLPATLTMAAFSLGLSAKIVARFGPKPPLVVGTLVFTVGLLLFARVPVDGAFIPDVLVPMFLLGIGSGMSFMPMFLIATAEATPAQAGLISGLVSTSQLIGGALGLALLAGLAAIRTGALLESGAAPPVALVGGFQAAFVLGAALSLITALLALTQLRGAQPSQESQPSRRDLIATVEA